MSASHTAIVVGGPTLTGGVVNSGSLTGTAGDGIYVGGFTTFGHAKMTSFSGGIVNTGTISAGSSGVFVIYVSSFSDGISNGGTISASAQQGIVVEDVANFAGGIANGGTISGHSGILVTTVSTFAGGIVNSAGGTISTGADGDGIAVNSVTNFVNGVSNTGGISNAGTISAALNAIILADGSNFSGGIANTGTISGANGITVNTVSTFAGGISNGGTVSGASHGIYVASVTTFGGGISNSGAITARTGIHIDGGVTFAGAAAIVNSGTISGTGGTAIDASAAMSPVIIDENAGAINGAIKLSAYADVLNINGGTIAGNIVGQGSSDTVNFQTGAGTTYVDNNAFAGINQVNINSGTVVLNGINSATNVDVYGTLSGSGSIDPTAVTIHSGGTFAPGNGTPGTSMAITGNLVLQSGALYQIYYRIRRRRLTPALQARPRSPARWTRPLLRAATSASNISSSRRARSAAPSPRWSTANLPSNFHDSLSYDGTDAYLDLTPNFTTPASTGLNGNQNNVANALIDYFNTNGGIPTKFATLPASALTQLDGEDATGAQKSAFQLMQDFLDMLLDPSLDGQGGGSGGGQATPFAAEQDSSLPPDIALAYAHALHQKPPSSQPQPQAFDQRWSAWGVGLRRLRHDGRQRHRRLD